MAINLKILALPVPSNVCNLPYTVTAHSIINKRMKYIFNNSVGDIYLKWHICVLRFLMTAFHSKLRANLPTSLSVWSFPQIA